VISLSKDAPLLDAPVYWTVVEALFHPEDAADALVIEFAA
jgi:hypothetical protein